MSNNIEQIPVNVEGVTVSRLLFTRFGRTIRGATEKTLDLNPGLADSAFIPKGTTVTIPVDYDGVAVEEIKKTVSFW